MFSNTKYSNEFRLKLVLEYLEENCGIREFGRKYGISPSHITNWIRLYKAYGREGLFITKKNILFRGIQNKSNKIYAR